MGQLYMKACERGTFRQIKVFKRDTFSVRMVYKCRGGSRGRIQRLSKAPPTVLNPWVLEKRFLFADFTDK